MDRNSVAVTSSTITGSKQGQPEVFESYQVNAETHPSHFSMCAEEHGDRIKGEAGGVQGSHFKTHSSTQTSVPLNKGDQQVGVRIATPAVTHPRRMRRGE